MGFSVGLTCLGWKLLKKKKGCLTKTTLAVNLGKVFDWITLILGRLGSAFYPTSIFFVVSLTLPVKSLISR